MDHASIADGYARPGQDTRMWFSYGTVAEDSPDARSVRFKDDAGVPFPVGPLVTVKLRPRGVPVVCRVSADIAGKGEGEWFPFVEQDEVLVGIPEGDEMAGAVILRRMNNGLDTWPATVAGQDATQNNFAFRRMRTPYVLETSSGYMIRNATTGSQFALDDLGQVILNDGDGARLFMGADAIGLSTPKDGATMQLLPATKQVTISADTATLFLDALASTFTTKGTLNLGTAGFPGSGHAVTAEQVISYLFAFATGLSAVVPALALPGAVVALINATILAAKIAPITPFSAALLTALSAPSDPTGQIPGVGRAGLML